MNLRRIDLNLLVALAALLDERSVTRAAERINLSQPAMSRVLGRLRVIFGDPLLVKSGRGMLLTSRAEQLREPLNAVLTNVQNFISPPVLQPGAMKGHVRLSATDGATITVLTRVLQEVVIEAPNVEFSIVPQSSTEDPEQLRTGRLDLAIGVYPEPGPGFHREVLYVDNRFSCLMRLDHPLSRRKLTVEAYQRAAHIDVLTGTGEIMERSLRAQGIQRTIRLRIGSFITAAAIAAHTDWLLTAPMLLANQLARTYGLSRRALPFELDYQPGGFFALYLLWHDRTNDDPLHRWLRAKLRDHFRRGGQSPDGPGRAPED